MTFFISTTYVAIYNHTHPKCCTTRLCHIWSWRGGRCSFALAK